VYPLSVALLSPKEDRRVAAEALMATLQQHNATLVSEVTDTFKAQHSRTSTEHSALTTVLVLFILSYHCEYMTRSTVSICSSVGAR
jgi:hypothetical protein